MGGSVPANTPFAMRLEKPSRPPSLRLVREDAVAGDIDVPVTLTPYPAPSLTYRISTEPFVPGTAYRFEYDDSCGDRTVRRFLVTAEAARPTVLGTMTASPVARETPGDTQWMNVSLVVDPNFAPWADLYSAEFLLDGKRVESRASVPLSAQNGFRLYGCGAGIAQPVSEGEHTVQLVAKAREFSGPTVRTDPTTIDFRCLAASPPTEDGQVATDDGGCTLARGTSRRTGSALSALAGLSAFGLTLVRRARRRQAREIPSRLSELGSPRHRR